MKKNRNEFVATKHIGKRSPSTEDILRAIILIKIHFRAILSKIVAKVFCLKNNFGLLSKEIFWEG